MTPAFVDVSSSGHVGPAVAAVMMVLIAAGFVALWVDARVRAARAARMAREADRATREGDAPLAAGPAVVFGTVEIARAESVAYRVEIDQHGTESESPRLCSFRWTEQGRTVTTRPFYVAHASGQRVRVEPQDRTYLVDAMNGMIVVNETLRTRYAELSPGKEVYAVGELGRAHDPESTSVGYREAPQGWVLRARRGEDLLLSSEPLDKRFLRRASAQRTISWITVLGAAVAALLAEPYFERMARGGDVVGTVITMNVHANRDETIYSLVVRLDDDTVLVLDTTHDDFAAVKEGSRVPVRYVQGSLLATALGHGSSAHVAQLGVEIAILVVMVLARAGIRKKHEEWYERQLVDKGLGKLKRNMETTSM